MARVHAVYVMRAEKYQGRTGNRYEDLEATASGNMPAWGEPDPAYFWAAADQHERKNGAVYREFVIALPREMTPEQRRDLVAEFADTVAGKVHPYTYGIHVPKASIEGGEQPHCHFMFSSRALDGIERDPDQFFRRYNAKHPELGGCQKADNGKQWLLDMRKAWGDIQNKHLEKGGYEDRVDHRNYKEQGIDIEPERKLGPARARALSQEQKDDLAERRQAVRDVKKSRRDLERNAEAIENLKKEQAKKRKELAARLKYEQADAFSKACGWAALGAECRAEWGQVFGRVAQEYPDIRDFKARQGEGDIMEYGRQGKTEFVDLGDKVLLANPSTQDEAAILAGMQLARAKWGKVHITGPDEFRERAALVAAKFNIPLADPDLNQFLKDKEAAARAAREAEREAERAQAEMARAAEKAAAEQEIKDEWAKEDAVPFYQRSGVYVYKSSGQEVKVMDIKNGVAVLQTPNGEKAGEEKTEHLRWFFCGERTMEDCASAQQEFEDSGRRSRHGSSLLEEYKAEREEKLAAEKAAMASRLFEVARSGDLDKLRSLVEAGADINAKDAEGRTILEAATDAEEWTAARCLVNAGADSSELSTEQRKALVTAFERENAPQQQQRNRGMER